MVAASLQTVWSGELDGPPPPSPALGRSNSLPSLNGEVENVARQSVVRQQAEQSERLRQREPSVIAMLIVNSALFRHTMSCAILLNVIELGTSTDMLDEPWKTVWIVFDNIFAAVFAVEMGLKLAAMGFRHYFSNRSNVFDFALAWIGIADMWVIHTFLTASKDSSIDSFGVLRIFRLLRLLRMLKVLTIQRQLMVVIEGIAASLSSMFWIGLLLTVIIYTFAIFCVVVIGRAEAGHPHREQLFGNIPRSMLSLFNITLLTEWPEVVWPLFEYQAWVVPLFVVFVIFASCGVLNVIIGVIVERTNEAGSKIREEDIRKHREKQLEMASMLSGLMRELDKDGDQKLTFEEMRWGMEEGGLQEVLYGLDLPSGFTLRHLYTMLDEDSDNHLSHKEFTVGMRRLITGNDFHRHCMVQTAIAQLKREVVKMKLQMHREVHTATEQVLYELRRVQEHHGIPLSEPWSPHAHPGYASRRSDPSMDSGPLVGREFGGVEVDSFKDNGPFCRENTAASFDPHSPLWDSSPWVSEGTRQAANQATDMQPPNPPTGGDVQSSAAAASPPAHAPLPDEQSHARVPGARGTSAFSRAMRHAAANFRKKQPTVQDREGAAALVDGKHDDPRLPALVLVNGASDPVKDLASEHSLEAFGEVGAAAAPPEHLAAAGIRGSWAEEHGSNSASRRDTEGRQLSRV